MASSNKTIYIAISIFVILTARFWLQSDVVKKYFLKPDVINSIIINPSIVNENKLKINVTNKYSYEFKDLVISCAFTSQSKTALLNNEYTIYNSFSKPVHIINNFKINKIPYQVKNVECKAINLTLISKNMSMEHVDDNYIKEIKSKTEHVDLKGLGGKKPKNENN